MIINHLLVPIAAVNKTNYSNRNLVDSIKVKMNDSVCFSGASSISKKVKFENLSKTEKKDFIKLTNYIFNKEKEILATLMGVKPTTLLYDPNFDKFVEKFKKHKSLLESKDIKVLIGKDFRGFNEAYVFHLPKLRKTVEKNIDFYRFKFGANDLSVNEIVKILTKKNGVLFNNNDTSLLGVSLGYPAPDAIIDDLSCQTDNALSLITNLGKYPNHEKLMAKISTIFSGPSFIKLATKLIKTCEPGSQGHNELKPFIGLKPIKELFFKTSPACKLNTPYYKFGSFADCPETEEMIKEIKIGIEKTKDKFKTPQDLLNYLLMT